MKNPIVTLLKKELLDTLRDRRTLLVMLVLPVVLYPGLLVFMGTVMSAGALRLARTELVIAVASDDAQSFVSAQAAPAHTIFTRMSVDEGRVALDDKKIAAVVDAAPGSFAAMKGGKQAKVTVLYTKKQDRSAEARDRLRKAFEALGHQTLVDRLAASQLPPEFSEPVITESTDIDFHHDLGPLVASRALPVMLLMMLFMGAMYPAVDLTAGEKERGTLETLLVSPVRPLQVMAAKYITVALTAIAATLANLGAMGVTFAFGISTAGGESISMKLSPAQIAIMLLCLVPAAFMAAGIALAVASMARSFKEGQSLMTPVILVAMMPGLVSIMPGVELNLWTAAIPLVNLGLLVKATILGAAPPECVGVVFASVTLCSYGTLRLAANAFSSEALRFGGTESWKELFRSNRKRS